MLKDSGFAAIALLVVFNNIYVLSALKFKTLPIPKLKPSKNRQVDLKNKPSNRGTGIASWVGDKCHRPQVYSEKRPLVSYRADAQPNNTGRGGPFFACLSAIPSI